jgi:hypothetical protein
MRFAGMSQMSPLSRYINKIPLFQKFSIKNPFRPEMAGIASTLIIAPFNNASEDSFKTRSNLLIIL